MMVGVVHVDVPIVVDMPVWVVMVESLEHALLLAQDHGVLKDLQLIGGERVRGDA